MDINNFQMVAYATVIIASIVGLHSVFLLARTDTSALVRIAYPVVFTLCILFAAKTFVDLRGYPVRMMPEGKNEYIHHEQDGNDIIVWLVLEDGRHRTFIIPNTDENREGMEEAKKGKEEGERQSVEMQKGFDKNNRIKDHPVVEVIDPAAANPK